MIKHPNEFTQHQIEKFFRGTGLDVEVNAIHGGYVVFFRLFSAIEACDVSDPAGRLIFDASSDFWKLYWMSGRSQWHIHESYPRLNQALAEMLSDHAAHLFHKVL
ncbi:MAG: DUF3024 domain-containing protein [Desulfuromonadales bacterium]|nr:DUF3024 domain-containing protein [Desulfuromonadales bacterium]